MRLRSCVASRNTSDSPRPLEHPPLETTHQSPQPAQWYSWRCVWVPTREGKETHCMAGRCESFTPGFTHTGSGENPPDLQSLPFRQSLLLLASQELFDGLKLAIIFENVCYTVKHRTAIRDSLVIIIQGPFSRNYATYWPLSCPPSSHRSKVMAAKEKMWNGRKTGDIKSIAETVIPLLCKSSQSKHFSFPCMPQLVFAAKLL